jgi:O-antigen ligase
MTNSSAARGRVTVALASVVVLAVGAIAGSHLAAPAFYLPAAALTVPVAYLAWQRPRAALAALVLAPLLDRFVVGQLVAPPLQPATAFTSEALLVVVGGAVLGRGIREHRLQQALRHPVVALLFAFAALGALSALLNGVPAVVALAGIGFTLDASLLFVLPRLVPFEARHTRMATDAFLAVAIAAALLAMGQVLVHPNFLGLESFSGRFSEGERVASIFVSPNLLGVVLAMALPFPAYRLAAARGADRLIPALTSLLLALALLYTFSRGAWLALLLAIVVTGLVVERRVIVVMALIGVVAFTIALVLPRHLLYADRANERFDLVAATFGRVEALGEGDLRVSFVANAMPIVRDHPLLGAGPGRYGGAVARSFGSPLYRTYTEGTAPVGRTVDKFWLHLLVESGVLGVAAFLGALLAGVVDALRRARRPLADARDAESGARLLLAAAAATVLVVALDGVTEMVLEGNTVSFAAWFCLGLATSLLRTPRGSAPPPTT